jgi:hypothetical protein
MQIFKTQSSKLDQALTYFRTYVKNINWREKFYALVNEILERFYKAQCKHCLFPTIISIKLSMIQR